jgi:ubiquinone/menaquinone biosynthesis C-methylase UbiE
MPLTAARCPICPTAPTRTVETAEPPYRVVRCQECGLVYVDPAPDAADLSRHYSRDYYAEWVSSQADKRRRMWARRLEAIARVTPTGHLLDVGCGDGAFLSLAMESGWTVEGTEVSAWAAEHATRTIGRPVFCGEVWAAGFPARSFDAVTLWHVLEHASAPLRVLEEARRVLRPGGRLVVAVPNVDDHVMQAVYRVVKGRKPHLFSVADKELHLYHFSVASLKGLLEKAGFGCIEVGPDFGIVELPKKLINYAAAALSRCFGAHWYNSIRMTARRA